MASRDELEKLKIPELKARAKEAKLKNYSKLKKADLIAALLRHAGTSSLLRTPEPDFGSPVPAGAPVAPHDLQLEPAPDAPLSTNSETSDSTSAPALTASAVSVLASSNPSIILSKKRSYHVADQNSTKVPTQKKARAPQADVPAAQPSLASQPLAARSRPLNNLNVARASHQGTSAPRFIALKRAPLQSSPLQEEVQPVSMPLSPAYPASMDPGACSVINSSTITASWIDKLFYTIQAQRTTPSQLPTPTSRFPLQLSFHGLHEHLYFQHPSIFHAALRFWISRLHTSLLLGSGTDAGATRSDLFGPDLTTWPVVTNCERLSSEILFVQTQGMMIGSERLKTALPVKQPQQKGRRRLLSLSNATDRTQSQGGQFWLATESFLVLAKTGEVIARSAWDASDNQDDSQTIRGCTVREDFLEYMAPIVERERAPAPQTGHDNFLLARSMSTAPAPTHIVEAVEMRSISSLVRTKDSWAYPQGISRQWQSSHANSEELQVAERAVVSSCLLAGISGTYESLAEQEAGWISGGDLAHEQTKHRLALYLPEAHQVQSVHLGGERYHTEIAFVTRQSGQTDIVLRSTGQVIGIEDQGGVLPLWCGILGCDEAGNECFISRQEFWSGWDSQIA